MSDSPVTTGAAATTVTSWVVVSLPPAPVTSRPTVNDPNGSEVSVIVAPEASP